MELIFCFIMCGVIAVGVRVYLGLFAIETVRHRAFERWCRTRPLVMALRCREGTTIDVYDHLRRQIEPADWFSNTRGGYPWQHYSIGVDGRRATDTLVLLFVTSCHQPRPRERPADLARAIEALGREVAPLVEEVWLHGQLHAVNHTAGDREHMAWVGTFEHSGQLQVDAMIGRPPWLSTIA